MNTEIQAIESIYAMVPKINCKGLCHGSCGPIMASPAEVKNVAIRHGSFPVPDMKNDATCSALKNNRCSIYKDRPMICRLWGVSETMKCEFGCKPDRYLTKSEGFALLDRLDAITEKDLK